MTENESVSDLIAGEIDAPGSSPDEAPASPQQVNKGINAKARAELENTTEGTAARGEQESARNRNQSSIRSGVDAEASEAVSSLNVVGIYESESNGRVKSEICNLEDPENEKMTDSNKVSLADNTAIQREYSENDEVSSLTFHQKSSDNICEDASAMKKSVEESTFSEADPVESNRVTAHQEDEFPLSSGNDADLAVSVENHACVLIEEFMPEPVSIDLALTSLDKRESLRNPDGTAQPCTKETPIGTLESLQNEISTSENAVDRGTEDPSSEDGDANDIVHVIEEKETKAIHEEVEGALKTDDSIPEDAVMQGLLLDKAEESSADNQNVEKADSHSAGSSEAAEVQGVKEETGEKGSAIPTNKVLPENASTTEQDIALNKEGADECKMATHKVIFEDPISFTDLVNAASVSPVQDVISCTPCDENLERADSAALSEVAEKQAFDPCVDRPIEAEADKTATSQVDASLLDGQTGQYNGDHEDSQEINLTVVAEAKNEQEYAVELETELEICKEDVGPPEASGETEILDKTQQELLTDLGSGPSTCDVTMDSVLSHREIMEGISKKDLPIHVEFTFPDQEVQGSDEVNQTERVNGGAESKGQADLIVELLTLKQTIVSHRSAVSEESLMYDDIEQAENKDNADSSRNDQSVAGSSKEVASKGTTTDCTDCDALDKCSDNSSSDEKLMPDMKSDLNISSKDDNALCIEHEDLSCENTEVDGSLELTGISADAPAFQTLDEHTALQLEGLGINYGCFSDEKHMAVEQVGLAKQFESEAQIEDLRTCMDTDSEDALSEDSTSTKFVHIAKDTGVSQAASPGKYFLHSTGASAKVHNFDDMVTSETESADKNLPFVQKDQDYTLLLEMEAHASVNLTSVTIDTPVDIQELEGHTKPASPDNAVVHEADVQETFSVFESEKGCRILEAASRMHVETPNAQESDDKESPQALKDITTGQEAVLVSEKSVQFESEEERPPPNGTYKSSDLPSLDEEIKDSNESMIEVNDVVTPSSHPNTYVSDTAAGVASFLRNAPEFLQGFTSSSVTGSIGRHEQIPEQGAITGKIGQVMGESQDLQHIHLCNLRSSSISAFECGQSEVSLEQPFVARNSIQDVHDEKQEGKLLEGVHALSPEDEIKNQVNSSPRCGNSSISQFVDAINDSYKKVVQSDVTCIPFAYKKEQTDVLDPATVEKLATVMSSDEPAEMPTLPISTHVTSFLDGHLANELLYDTKKVLTMPQVCKFSSTGSANDAPKDSKKGSSYENASLPSNGTIHADDNLPNTASGVFSTLPHGVSPDTDKKFQNQVKVGEKQAKEEISFLWSLILCCSSKEG